MLCTQFEGAPATEVCARYRKCTPLTVGQRWGSVCLRCLTFTSLPPWINPSLLPDLSNLSLSLQVLRQADMEILGRLRMLRRIGIHDTLLFRKLRFCTMATTSIRFVPPPAAVTTPVSVMPYLELLHFSLDVHFFKDRKIAFDIGLEHLPSSLRTVKVFVLCHLAKALRQHPSQPSRPSTRKIGRR